MFDLIILVAVDIVSKVLFNSLIESFCLSIGLRVKGCKKLVVYFESYYKYCKEL